MVLKSRFVAGMLFILAQVAAAQPASWEDRLVGSGRWGWTYYDDNPIYSVAISGDGATVVVGGTGDGAARVFERSAGAWSQQASLPLPSDAVGPSWDAFSAAISADGNTVLVGDPGDDGLTGAAWVYTRSGGAWAQQGPKLVGSGAVGFVYQGLSVAISADGNTAVVGGPWDIGGAGAAWVYTRSGGVWSQQAKLVGAFSGPQPFQGTSVAVSADGNTVIVGGPNDAGGIGAAWVYTRSGGVWSHQQKLFGSGAVGGWVGRGASVALSSDGNTAIVGGPWDDEFAGAAWVFTRSNGVWTQQGPKLVGTGAMGQARQGSSVAISSDGNRAIVGGPWDDGEAGAAWIFTRSGATWTQLGATLVGRGALGAAHQGLSVAISGNGATLIVGGPTDGHGGSAWVYLRKPGPYWVPMTSHTE